MFLGIECIENKYKKKNIPDIFTRNHMLKLNKKENKWPKYEYISLSKCN